VVVFPCVPLTTMGMPSGRENLLEYFRHRSDTESCGPELPRALDFTRDKLLPTITRSGAGRKCVASNSLKKDIPRLSSKLEAGGINSGIRPRHAKAMFAQHPSQWRHSRSANPNHMHMFCLAQATTAGSRNSSVPSPSAVQTAP